MNGVTYFLYLPVQSFPSLPPVSIVSISIEQIELNIFQVSPLPLVIPFSLSLRIRSLSFLFVIIGHSMLRRWVCDMDIHSPLPTGQRLRIAQVEAFAHSRAILMRLMLRKPSQPFLFLLFLAHSSTNDLFSREIWSITYDHCLVHSVILSLDKCHSLCSFHTLPEKFD